MTVLVYFTLYRPVRWKIGFRSRRVIDWAFCGHTAQTVKIEHAPCWRQLLLLKRTILRVWCSGRSRTSQTGRGSNPIVWQFFPKKKHENECFMNCPSLGSASVTSGRYLLLINKMIMLLKTKKMDNGVFTLSEIKYNDVSQKCFSKKLLYLLFYPFCD